MSTKKEIWRLLEPGVDVWQEGDETCGPYGWHATNYFGGVVKDGEDGRRRMTLPEPQGWISVKERMPTKEDADVLLWNGNVCYLSSSDRVLIASPTHWMSLPNPPAPIDPDEEAWEEWSKNNLMRNYSVGNAEADAALKEGFMAGRKSVATDGGTHG